MNGPTSFRKPVSISNCSSYLLPPKFENWLHDHGALSHREVEMKIITDNPAKVICILGGNFSWHAISVQPSLCMYSKM